MRSFKMWGTALMAIALILAPMASPVEAADQNSVAGVVEVTKDGDGEAISATIGKTQVAPESIGAVIEFDGLDVVATGEMQTQDDGSVIFIVETVEQQ